MAENPNITIEVREGERQQRLVFEQPRITVGRSLRNEVAILDRLASRVHCSIEWSEGKLLLTDLGSQNGTVVNGERVLARDLRRGDVIRVGAAEIEVGGVAPVAEEPGTESPAESAAGAVEESAGGDSVARARPDSALLAELSRERAFLLRLIAVARDVASEQDLMPLLGRVLDAVLELTGAERAFVVLSDGKGGLECETSRNFEGSEVRNAEVAVSRSIAQQVIASGQPLFTVNAREDERFKAVQSIVNLGLRSVLCVPLRFREQVLGVVYIDNRLEAAAFSTKDRDRLTVFADQAAIAIANARLIRDLTESNKALAVARARLEALNRDLRRTVSDREAELASARARLAGDEPPEGELKYESVGILGRSAAMRQVFELLDRVVESEFPVLVEGESGTGKELLARAIHRLGSRRSEAFVSENCAALPESLLESELFGSVKGAFTGATNRRGLLERAHGGTLFLDEVSEMSPSLQAKLLRFLQEGEFRPVGRSDPVRVDVRIISACNKDLRQLAKDGGFREDLFYRLNVLPVKLPPLRARREDVPLLVERFISRAAAALSRQPPAIEPEVIEVFARYSWPGNIREMENEVRRLVTVCDGTITVNRVSQHILKPASEAVEDEDGDLTSMVQAIEMREIKRALEQYHGNKSRAAQLLGISRFALNRKLEKYGIESGDPE
jgi:transcriptional regulator with GAF, ATPase, and Fis domain